MSSFVRTIQRAATRKKYFGGRGSRLGVVNPNETCAKRRRLREEALQKLRESLS